MENQSYSKTSICSIPPSARLLKYSFKQQPNILKNMQHLLVQEAKLELQFSTFPTNEALLKTYQELTQQLRLQLRRAERSRWDSRLQNQQVSVMEEKIKSILYKMRKLKQINIYFHELSKQEGSLEAEVEKFMFYMPKTDNMYKKLVDFLKEPAVSEIILKEYEKSFNPNNFVADIIEFFQFLAQNRLLEIPAQEQSTWIRNSDLQLIQNKSILFRQICQISDKYTLVQSQLRNAYIHLDFLQEIPKQNMLKQLSNKSQLETVEAKMHKISIIAQKIKRHAGNLYTFYNDFETILISEEGDIFESISSEFDYNLKDRNDNFFTFLEELYEGKQTLEPGPEGNFNFIRQKIIKTEMRWHLNRLFSAFNLGSHIATKVHDNITSQPKHFTFTSPSLLIKYELNSKRISFYSERPSEDQQLQILSKVVEVIQKEEGFILQVQRSKVVYPSAVHGYYYLLKYLLCLSTILSQKKIYNEQLLLEITSIKADQMMQWAQTIHNLFEMIKGRYFGCYQVLKAYIQLVFKSRWIEELQYVKRQISGTNGIEQLLSYYSGKQKKARWINQIIFELDSTFDIFEPLQSLYQIEKMHYQTLHCSDHHHFYEVILNEVIQTRNNLIFERCFSFSALHQMFSFASAKPSNFEELAQKLTPLSKNRMRLPDLLRLYHCQSKIKRELFKAQVYWIRIASPTVKNKFICTNQKKKISFKDFLEENAKFLLNLSEKSLEYFLDNLEEVERAVLLFSHEVERLKLIQASLMLFKPDFPLEDHISAFNYKELTGFFNYCANFNVVQDIYLKRDKKREVLSQIKKAVQESRFKFCELGMEENMVSLKNLFAGFIFLTYAFGQHLTAEDCLSLKVNVIDRGENSQKHLKLQIWRSKKQIVKEYEQSQFLDWQSLAQIVQIYQLLILLTINSALNRDDIPIQDKLIFSQLQQVLPTFSAFRKLEHLQEIEKIKGFASTSSKSSSLSALICVMNDFKQRRDKFKGYSCQWPTIQSIFILSEIGIVSRRIFCNLLLELKHEVSGEQWKYFNKQTCLSNLRQRFDRLFIAKINQFLVQQLQSTELLNSNHSISQHISFLNQIAKQQIVQQFDDKFAFEVQDKRPIILFDEERGIEVQCKEEDLSETAANFNVSRRNRGHFKRGLVNAIKMESNDTAAFASALQQKVNLEIVRQSLPVRKMIYHLQLEQKRIRDEISWETCKLEHTVISKINNFIEESNLDQKQSLINFKYTVNLETIKGIENVIHERAEIFMKKQLEQDTFLTEPEPRVPKEKENAEQSLLDINVRNVFNHVKKIKVFWAWKRMYLSKQCGQDQWAQFSINAQRILYNQQAISKLRRLQESRKRCSQQQILANLIKEENSMINNSIRDVKIANLTNKLREFKVKYQIDEEPQDQRNSLAQRIERQEIKI